MKQNSTRTYAPWQLALTILICLDTGKVLKGLLQVPFESKYRQEEDIGQDQIIRPITNGILWAKFQ